VKRDTARLEGETFDLLIIGGGITGAGVALDAALQGWRVALVDKGDFASGTSSASSKLVHGGLRYLEHGDFRLVYEALHERHRLLRNAAHLVQPLRFVIPFYRKERIPGWQWRLALAGYDLLAGRGNIARSRPLSRRAVLDNVSGLRGDVLGGAAYFDAQMDDARLCLSVIKTAAARNAAVANYVQVRTFERHGEQITGVVAQDMVSGADLRIRARQILNATGAWLDETCLRTGDQSGPHLQPTKGVHIIVRGRGLRSALLLLHPRDGRVFFVIPWGRTVLHNGRSPGPVDTMIGTTDTESPEGPDSLTVAGPEIDYLLEGFNHYFEPALAHSDVISSFAGLRPLIRQRKGSPSARTREYRVFESQGGVLNVAGGKYTTHRQIAEVITRKLALRFGRPYRPLSRDFLLDGAAAENWNRFEERTVAQLSRQLALAEVPARHLVRRYGSRCGDVAGLIAERPDLREPVIPGEPDLRAELVYQVRHEMAVFPEDSLRRRTRLVLFHPDLRHAGTWMEWPAGIESPGLSAPATRRTDGGTLASSASST
jgi:glycerol-3-phosphate dehydrogenase